MYSRPSCVQCTATVRRLDKNAVERTTVDTSQDAQAREFSMSLGFMQAPVLVVTDADGTILDKWSGFNPGKIDEWSEKLSSRILQAA